MSQNASEKILVVALSGIGNFLMQSPAISLLKEKYPNSRITCWVAPRGTKILAENHPSIDEVIETPIKQSLFEHLTFIKILRNHHFSISIILSPGQLFKSAFYMWAAGIPRRISASYLFFGNPKSSFLLTDAMDEDESLHDIEQNIRLLAPLEIVPNNELTSYSLLLIASTQEKAQDWLKKNSLLDKYLIGIHAGCAPNFLWKRWPIDRFASVAKSLLPTHPNVHILLFGGPDEAQQKQDLKNQIGLPQVTLVDTDLLTTAAIMQHCRLIITNDSGLMHLSAASGAATLGLFGPTDEKQTGPRGQHAHVLRAPGTQSIYHTELNYSLGDSSHPSLLAITPAMVLAEAKKLV